MENLSQLWKEETLRGLTRLEPREISYYKPDFEVLNLALKVLYHIMGGKVQQTNLIRHY